MLRSYCCSCRRLLWMNPLINRYAVWIHPQRRSLRSFRTTGCPSLLQGWLWGRKDEQPRDKLFERLNLLGWLNPLSPLNSLNLLNLTILCMEKD